MPKVNLKNPVPKKRLCENGILAEYEKYTEDREGCQDFHIWTCISLISSSLGRNVFFPRGDWVIYPNMYIILVGESALARKTSTLRTGTQILRTAHGEGINFASQKLSPEYLIHKLSILFEEQQKAEVISHASELSNLLGKTKINDSILKILADLYDCPDWWEYGTMGRGEEKCNNVCVGILAGSTHAWLRDSLPEESLEGGFFSRLLLIDRISSGNLNANPEDGYDLEKQRFKDNIINDLRIAREMTGKFYWSEDAKEMWSSWYTNIAYSFPENIPNFMRGYYGRKGDMLIKLCMCISASLRDTQIVEAEDFMFALNLINENEDHLENMMDVMSTTKEGRDKDIVANHIRHAQDKLLSRSQLMQKVSNRFNARGLDSIIQTLEEEGLIEVIHDTSKRRKTIYKWSK